MATDKKHIAVYLDPAVEQALIAFCERKELKSKKGTMFSAGVNAALSEFFGISDTEKSNTPQNVDNIPQAVSNTPQETSNILSSSGNTPASADNTILSNVSNIPDKSLAVDIMPKKPSLSESEAESLSQELRELRSQLEAVQVEREDLAQLKKQVKEHAAELHREGRSIELEKDRWQGELSEARADLAAANATIVQQKGKILELERGYSLKPNPAERRLRLEIGELQTELADLKQKSATAGKDLPEAADLLNQLKSKRRKSTVSLADVETLLEIIEKSCDDTPKGL